MAERESQWQLTQTVVALTVKQRGRLFNAGLIITFTPLWLAPLLLVLDKFSWIWFSFMGFVAFVGLFMMLPTKTLHFIEALGGLVVRIPVPWRRKEAKPDAD